MAAHAWAAAHLRPRDLFIGGAVTLLLGLAAGVWTTRQPSEQVSTVLSLILGSVTTLGGYYQGHKDADSAGEREDAARQRLAFLEAELARTRQELGEMHVKTAAFATMLANTTHELEEKP